MIKQNHVLNIKLDFDNWYQFNVCIININNIRKILIVSGTDNAYYEITDNAHY